MINYTDALYKIQNDGAIVKAVDRDNFCWKAFDGVPPQVIENYFYRNGHSFKIEKSLKGTSDYNIDNFKDHTFEILPNSTLTQE